MGPLESSGVGSWEGGASETRVGRGSIHLGSITGSSRTQLCFTVSFELFNNADPLLLLVRLRFAVGQESGRGAVCILNASQDPA